jgi:hypothetical protein
MILFKLREGKLYMTVINRSNDIHWGLYAVNFPTFGLLQELLASMLGVYMGEQTHLSNSLHYYVDQPEVMQINDRMIGGDKLAKSLPTPLHDMAFIPGELKGYEYWDLAAEAYDLIDLKPLPNNSPRFFHYAEDFLACYRERNLDRLKNWPKFADWNLAAQTWKQEVWDKH